MTRVQTGAVAVFAAAALAAGFLAACGGSDSGTSSGSAATESTGASSGGQRDGAKRSQNGGSQAQRKGASRGGEGSGGSAQVSAPLRVSGGGSKQFRSKGGDNSIQDFGEESDKAELEEAAQALHAFYVARAEKDWPRACSYLSSSLQQQLKQLSLRSADLKDKGCPRLLHAFTPPLPASLRRETTIVDAASLRTEDDQSFLIYRGEGGTVYAIPMKEEDGEWKVGVLAPTPL